MTSGAIADAPARRSAVSGVPQRLSAALAAVRAHVVRLRGPYGVAALTFGVYLLLSIRRYQHYQVPSWDLGIFDQAIRNLAAFHAPVSLIKGVGFNVFGDHFHPVIALLVPVYWLAPTAMSLLVVQDLLVAASAFVVTKAARTVVGGYSGVALGLSYAFSWGLQEAVVAQFHEVAFALPLLAASLTALVAGRWLTCALWALPLVLVKEDLGLTVVVIGLLVVLRSRGRQAALGGALAAWGAAWFVVAVKVVLPAVNGQGVWDYSRQVPWGTLSDPVTVAERLVQPTEKLHTLAYILGITGFLALRSPLVLAVLPTLAWRFLSDTPAYWGRLWHYSAVLMPIMFLALIDAIRAVRARPVSSRPSLLRAYAAVAAPVCATVAVMLTINGLPVRELVRPSFYRPDARNTAAERVLALIPAGSSVESDAGLVTYLTDRDDVYWMGRTGNPAPEYLLVDGRNGGWPTPPSDVVAYAEQLHPGTTYVKIFDTDGYVLVERVTG
ncbi:MAG TPA: DUF2079 domain-containing protein [Kineosporiaceae bacterium]|nr:DUF2079 domain-containing protein [Kineosporiaceae bacterium]